jgi:hypothetical protein
MKSGMTLMGERIERENVGETFMLSHSAAITASTANQSNHGKSKLPRKCFVVLKFKVHSRMREKLMFPKCL